ncbi:ribosomal protein L31e-domain-containing protein [Chiua virens]|nr:ribosomal protein L31e-domain-containing protein [Chiua virens]
MARTKGAKTGKRSALQDVVTREYTIHLHKLVHGRSFKKRAPWAVKSVVEFARKSMGTKDVRLDPKLNQALWAQGIKTVPHRIRVKLERKRNDEENAKEKLYTYASHVPVVSFKAGSANNSGRRRVKGASSDRFICTHFYLHSLGWSANEVIIKYARLDVLVVTLFITPTSGHSIAYKDNVHADKTPADLRAKINERNYLDA